MKEISRKQLQREIPGLAEKPGAKVEEVKLTPEKIARMKRLLAEGRKAFDEVNGALTGRTRLSGKTYT
jgi:hypothetical protein